MKIFPAVLLFLIFPALAVGQQLSRQQKLQQIDYLNAQIKELEQDVLRPSASDIKKAQADGVEVVRLMPREKYDHKLTVEGGGSYYSFSTNSHDYQKTPQIGLERDTFKVGFAGADYGFISDLGETLLSTVGRETPAVSLLAAYKPAGGDAETRQSFVNGSNGFFYKNRLPVALDHTYILRAISFREADILVAFTVFRRDDDGSYILLWKKLADFDVPTFARRN